MVASDGAATTEPNNILLTTRRHRIVATIVCATLRSVGVVPCGSECATSIPAEKRPWRSGVGGARDNK